jgi:hypothetical protein
MKECCFVCNSRAAGIITGLDAWLHFDGFSTVNMEELMDWNFTIRWIPSTHISGKLLVGDTYTQRSSVQQHEVHRGVDPDPRGPDKSGIGRLPQEQICSDDDPGLGTACRSWLDLAVQNRWSSYFPDQRLYQVVCAVPLLDCWPAGACDWTTRIISAILRIRCSHAERKLLKLLMIE